MNNQKLSETLINKIIHDIDVGVTLVNLNGEIVYANPESEKLLGIKKDEQGNMYNIINCHPDNLKEKFQEKLQQKNMPKRSWHRTIHSCGRWVKSQLSMVSLPEFQGVIVISRDATEEVTLKQELEKAHQKLQYKYQTVKEMAITDGLTGLYNRQYMKQLISGVIKIDTELSGVLVIDINKFKQINDEYGHAEGDKILQQTANILKKSIRKDTDIAIRYGGDEFLLLLPGCSEDKTKQIKNRITSLVNTWNKNSTSSSPKLDLAIGYTSGKTDDLHKRHQ
ncbi:diguanylate cyclase (GGDEF)-like protein/PAS domain S-box-containing protein [Desulfitispora alkaliphila]|uniref:sensor domain-containing diguanylate cyclase n=1 Tax=Desulfitispora alkaliphila TaxID=622674 RepID=UPI003D19F46B